MSGRRGWATTLLGLALATPVGQAATLIHSVDGTGLERGEADGVAVSSRGRLFLAPRLLRLGDRDSASESVYVWDVAADANGTFFLATGPEGRVVRVSPTGRHSTFFDVDEPMVTALAILPDRHLLVATAPGGRIYRVDADGHGSLWCETGERYVWALVPTPDGRVFAGTGETGAILEISSAGRSRPFFDSDDSHIVSLIALPDGGMLAGGAGAGLVYRIDPEGNGQVLYDDPLPEVSALLLEPDGSVLASFVAPPVPESRAPALRIRLPDGTTVGAATDGVTGFDDSERGSLLTGVIEGLPGAEQRGGPATQGRLVRIAPSGASTTLWRSSDETPFALARAEGQVLFGTGEPARLYRLEDEDEVALLATLPEGQVTGLLGLGRSTVLATSNPAVLYRVARQTGESGVYVSRPYDAGGPARWGSVRWRIAGADAGAELYTRTGNSAIPDETWSAWSPALTVPARSAIVNPDGRYLQWRVRFAGSHGDSVRVSDVRIHYEPYNRPPQLREFFLDGTETAVTDSATIRWSTFDPDDDPVEVALQFRNLGAEGWRDIRGPHDARPAEPGTPGVDWREDRVILDTSALAEGDYEFRARVSDQPGNPPGEGRSSVGDEILWLTVDLTPPSIAVEPSADGGFELEARDGFTDLRALEVRSDGRIRFTARPLDGVYDSRVERFRFRLPADENGAIWSVRAIDSAGNKVEAPLTRP